MQRNVSCEFFLEFFSNEFQDWKIYLIILFHIFYCSPFFIAVVFAVAALAALDTRGKFSLEKYYENIY